MCRAVNGLHRVKRLFEMRDEAQRSTDADIPKAESDLRRVGVHVVMRNKFAVPSAQKVTTLRGRYNIAANSVRIDSKFSTFARVVTYIQRVPEKYGVQV